MSISTHTSSPPFYPLRLVKVATASTHGNRSYPVTKTAQQRRQNKDERRSACTVVQALPCKTTRARLASPSPARSTYKDQSEERGNLQRVSQARATDNALPCSQVGLSNESAAFRPPARSVEANMQNATGGDRQGPEPVPSSAAEPNAGATSLALVEAARAR